MIAVSFSSSTVSNSLIMNSMFDCLGIFVRSVGIQISVGIISSIQ